MTLQIKANRPAKRLPSPALVTKKPHRQQASGAKGDRKKREVLHVSDPDAIRLSAGYLPRLFMPAIRDDRGGIRAAISVSSALNMAWHDDILRIRVIRRRPAQASPRRRCLQGLADASLIVRIDALADFTADQDACDGASHSRHGFATTPTDLIAGDTAQNAA